MIHWRGLGRLPLERNRAGEHRIGETISVEELSEFRDPSTEIVGARGLLVALGRCWCRRGRGMGWTRRCVRRLI